MCNCWTSDKTPEFPIYDESEMEEEAYYGFDEEENHLRLVVTMMRHGFFPVKYETLLLWPTLTVWVCYEVARQLRGMGVDEACVLAVPRMVTLGSYW